MHSRPLVEGPGIVVGRKGTAGSVSWSDGDFFPIDTTYWVKLRDSNALDLRFTALLLESVDLPAICAQTGVPGLNRERAYEITVNLPSRPEQRRIVDLVGALDAQIAALSLESLAVRAVLTSAAETTWRSTNTSAPIASLGRIVTGSTPKTSDTGNWSVNEVPFLTPGDLADLSVLDRTDRFVSKAGADSGRRIPPGSVSVVCIGATIGKVGVTARELLTNQQINSVVGLGSYDAMVLALLLSAPSGRRSLMDAAGQTAVPILNKSAFGQIVVPWPAINDRMHLGELASDTLALRETQDAEINALRSLRQTVVADLLSGALEVPDSYDEFLSKAA